MVDKFTRKASSGKYRVIGYDLYDYRDYFINESSNLKERGVGSVF